MTPRSKSSAPITLLYVSALLSMLCSCMGDIRYLAYTTIEYDDWADTDTLTYIINPMSNPEKGGLSLLLHTEKYEYTNIALHITVKQDSTLLYCNQHNYLLKDHAPKHNFGCWYSYTLPVSNITLSDTLPTTITITHQLNQPILTGIRRVGISITTPLRQPGEPVWRVNW